MKNIEIKTERHKCEKQQYKVYWGYNEEFIVLACQIVNIDMTVLEENIEG
jgi:hypothetical protein